MYLDYLEWTWYILHMVFLLFSSVLLCCTSKGVKCSLLYAIYDVSAYTDDGIQMHAKK